MIQGIQQYLFGCRGLNRFCSQNGWVDSDSLRFEMQEWGNDSALVTVWFTEMLMEGPGCVADELPRFGKLRLSLGAEESIRSAHEA